MLEPSGDPAILVSDSNKLSIEHLLELHDRAVMDSVAHVKELNRKLSRRRDYREELSGKR